MIYRFSDKMVLPGIGNIKGMKDAILLIDFTVSLFWMAFKIWPTFKIFAVCVDGSINPNSHMATSYMLMHYTVCALIMFVFQWGRMQSRLMHIYLHDSVCVFMKYGQAHFSLLILMQFHEFGQRHFTEHNSVLQRHQKSARRTFQELGSSTSPKRWSKHFHLNNGCCNLNDLTGTSSLLTEGGYYKESVIYMGQVKTDLPGTQAHNPSCSGYFPWFCIWNHNVKRHRQHNHHTGSASCFMKMPWWPMDSHAILLLSNENLASQVHKLVGKLP